jgi:DNA repair exonuclease SbcCD ATPase subunit
MNSEDQRERVMAWACMMQDRPHSFASGHLPNYADFSAVLLAQEAEIEQLRQQVAEFAQERGNFARTIFELRGIIEQAEAQTHEIGSLRDHSYKQADRIKELKEQIEAYRNYGSIKQKKVTRLREALKQVRSRVEHPRVYADVIDIIDEALAGASDEKDSKAAKELAVWLLRKDEVDRDMRRQVDSLWERTDIYVDLQEKQQEQIDALEGQASARAVCDEEHMLAIERRIDALEKRIDFHSVNNPLNGNPDDISLHELISVVDQRCALIEQALGGMTEEATFEKIDKLTEAVLAMDAEYGFSYPIVLKALNKLRATQGMAELFPLK